MGAFALLSSALNPGTNAATYYVSPHGNDAWSGRIAFPNRAKTDGPFATVARAQNEARRAKTGGTVRVLVRGGTYFLDKPLQFAPIDSGDPGSPVVYEAFRQEKPILSGGMRLTGLRKSDDGKWTLRIPEVARGSWTFSQLFIDGVRRPRARLPKSGYFTIAERLPSGTPGKGDDRFRYSADDLNPHWHDFGNVEVLNFHIWGMSRLRPKSIDPEKRTVVFTGSTGWDTFWAGLEKGRRYLVENVREALTEPGEWYLDRQTGILTVLPLPGEDLSKAVVVAPKLERLVDFVGTPEGPVHDIAFRGIGFEHTAFNLTPQGRNFPQAESDLSAAVRFEFAQRCSLERCEVRGTGGYAVEALDGCSDIVVSDCEMTDLGAGGVKIGVPDFPPRPGCTTERVTVKDCLIAHGGRLHPAAIGVWIGHSAHNQVLRNEIADLYYTGVSVGWSWGYGPSGAHHNRIEGNHIHDIGHGVLSDMGGIYTLGVSPGTVLRANRIHDVESFDYGGWGLYTDEGSTGIVLEDNVVYRTSRAGFHQHYGKENLVRRNVFCNAGEAMLQRTRAEEHRSFTFENNVLVWKDVPTLTGNWSGSNYLFRKNLYWRTDGKPVEFGGKAFSEWQAVGQDLGSVVADPLFVDPEKGDFRLRHGSPALALGFQAMDPRMGPPRRVRSPKNAPPAFPWR